MAVGYQNRGRRAIGGYCTCHRNPGVIARVTVTQGLLHVSRNPDRMAKHTSNVDQIVLDPKRICLPPCTLTQMALRGRGYDRYEGVLRSRTSRRFDAS